MAEQVGPLAFTECERDVATIQDALDLIGLCRARDTDRLLIDASRFPEAFFDLSTGFAGEFVQKMHNYGIRVAAVFPEDRPFSSSFAAFLHEARRGPGFRAFGSRADAEGWLTT